MLCCPHVATSPSCPRRCRHMPLARLDRSRRPDHVQCVRLQRCGSPAARQGAQRAAAGGEGSVAASPRADGSLQLILRQAASGCERRAPDQLHPAAAAAAAAAVGCVARMLACPQLLRCTVLLCWVCAAGHSCHSLQLAAKLHSGGRGCAAGKIVTLQRCAVGVQCCRFLPCAAGGLGHAVMLLVSLRNLLPQSACPSPAGA